jgi:peptide/nickel transport system substrate-binding protein
MKNDRSKNVSTILVIQILLIVSLFTLIPIDAYSAQPPIDLTSYYVGTIGQPRRVDPTRAYDTASRELIFNVYETLIFFSDKPVPAIPTNYSIDMLNQPKADLSLFNNVLCTNLVISPDNETWAFTIDTTIPWQPWQAANGTWYYQFVTAEDVEYSFKRLLVQDMTGSPSWMICQPLCGYMYFDSFNFPGDEGLVLNIINTAVTRLGNTVSLHMKPGLPWPQTAFKQILAHTVSSIVNKDWCIEHGCWDGSFAAGWSANYRQKPNDSYTPLDQYYAAKSKYPSSSSVPAMCGTGPYIFNYWNKATLEYNVYAWENLVIPGEVIPASHVTYRGEWTAGGNIHSLRTITVKGIAEWSTRKMLFLAGDTDITAVPRSELWDLTITGLYDPLGGITLYYDIAELRNEALFFVDNVAGGGPFMPKVGGIDKPDFFSDPHMRKAFMYSLDFSSPTGYLQEAWEGEAMQPSSWWVRGLVPDYEVYSIPLYNLSYSNMTEEFTAAGVWKSGFETYLVHETGNEEARIACEMIRDAVQSLNSLRVGLPPFKVNVRSLESSMMDYKYKEAFYMPMFVSGHLADYADADNFARVYMHSLGNFAYFQHYGYSDTDALIDIGMATPDGPARQSIYEQLQYIYHYSPGLPLVQALGRRWQRDWVRGWYCNQLYPGDFYYDLWKTVAAAPTLVDLDAAVMDVPAYLASLGYGNTIEIAYPYGTDFSPTVNIAFSVTRNDAVAAQVPAVMAVTYTNSAGYAIAIDAYYVLLDPAPAIKTEYFMLDLPSQAIGLYNVTGRVYVSSSYYEDSNMANNVDDGGQYNATWLLGDMQNDRIVEMMDFYAASKAVWSVSNEKGTSANWNIRCDIAHDYFDIHNPPTSPTYIGNGEVDIYDFFALWWQYSKKLPGG